MNIEKLANELLLDLFEYLDGIHLFRAFYNLNCRFNNLLLIYFRRYSFNFKYISKNDFDYLCDQCFPLIIDRIVTLRLWNDDETPEQINYFLSHYLRFDQFINLESLSLSNINCEQTMSQIMNELSHLSNLVHLNIVDSWHIEVKYIDIIWSLPKLTQCKLNRIFCVDLNAVPTVVSLSLRNVSIWCSADDRSSVNRLLEYTPYLQHFSMSLIDHDCQQISFDIPSMKTLKISCEDSASGLKNLLSHMINLSKLRVRTFAINMDGYQWEKIITNYLSKLKIFELYMIIPSDNNNTCEQKVDEILNPFRTPFWINKHRWFVRCHWNPEDDDRFWYYLYTLPYTSNSLFHAMSTHFKSTCPNQDYYSSYDHVRELSYSWIPRFVSHISFPKIDELSLTLPHEENFWSVIPTVDQLTSLHIDIENESQSQLQILLEKTPRLQTLGLSTTSIPQMLLSQISNKSIQRLDFQYIDEVFNEETCATLIHSSLGIQCQFLIITVENPTNIIYLVNHMKNLRALKVQCGNINDSNYYRTDQSKEERDKLFKWLQQHLSFTSIISSKPREPFILLWIR